MAQSVISPLDEELAGRSRSCHLTSAEFLEVAVQEAAKNGHQAVERRRFHRKGGKKALQARVDDKRAGGGVHARHVSAVRRLGRKLTGHDGASNQHWSVDAENVPPDMIQLLYHSRCPALPFQPCQLTVSLQMGSRRAWKSVLAVIEGRTCQQHKLKLLTTCANLSPTPTHLQCSSASAFGGRTSGLRGKQDRRCCA